MIDAMLTFKNIRYHVVQIQQFLTDSSAVGEADYSEARNERDAALNDTIEMSIKVPVDEYEAYHTLNPLILKGKIVRLQPTDGELICGIHFIDMSENAMAALEKSINYFSAVCSTRKIYGITCSSRDLIWQLPVLRKRLSGQI